MIDVAEVCAVAVGAINTLVGLWGAWLWWTVHASSRPWWVSVRGAQAAAGLQAVLAGLVYLTARDDVDDGLYYLYAVLPVVVGFASEQLRALSAQSVLDAREIPDAQAVGGLPAEQQRSVVVAIMRRETGVMTLACLMVAFLCWRAVITL